MTNTLLLTNACPKPPACGATSPPKNTHTHCASRIAPSWGCLLSSSTRNPCRNPHPYKTHTPTKPTPQQPLRPAPPPPTHLLLVCQQLLLQCLVSLRCGPTTTRAGQGAVGHNTLTVYPVGVFCVVDEWVGVMTAGTGEWQQTHRQTHSWRLEGPPMQNTVYFSPRTTQAHTRAVPGNHTLPPHPPPSPPPPPAHHTTPSYLQSISGLLLTMMQPRACM